MRSILLLKGHNNTIRSFVPNSPIRVRMYTTIRSTAMKMMTHQQLCFFTITSRYHRHYGRNTFNAIIKLSSSSVTSTTHCRIQDERRCYYHELAYQTNGKPWSCINYYSSNDESNHSINNMLLDEQHPYITHPCWVNVEMIAAPYNPADALSIQGVYPNPYHGNYYHHTNTQPQNNNTNPYERIAQLSRRSLSKDGNGISGTVPGSEGWGRIIDIHTTGTTNSNELTPQDSKLRIGDYVVLGQPGLGTFRSSMWLPSTSVIQLHHGQELLDRYGPTVPAPLFQTAGTALRMLRDYCPISSSSSFSYQPQQRQLRIQDDSDSIAIVQNAGNSAVGLMVSQIATKIMNYQCISIIRSSHRTDQEMKELKTHMTEYGNPTQIVEEESILKSDDLRNIVPLCATRNIRLGLNAVGGDSIHSLLQMITSNQKDDSNSGINATIVTYGNMSKQSYIPIDPSHLIFQNINFTGFWYSRWMVQQQYQQYVGDGISRTNDETRHVKHPDLRSIMMNEIVDAVLFRSLQCPPVQAYHLCEYKIAFEQSKLPNNIKPKIVFDCRQ